METQPPAPRDGDVRLNGDVLEYFTDGRWVAQEELPDVTAFPADTMRAAGDEDPQLS
ncbi:hypothetical protein [Actinomadura coerulea]|uniref:hypothetical protein n=1 Tax=Actinomadura coerulea TaxID=46159 RepID=UPI003413B140